MPLGDAPELGQRSNLVATTTDDQPVDAEETPGLIGGAVRETSNDREQ